MFLYENQVCDVCGQTFDKDDDIVVCPDCGTPHHRECWVNRGQCVNHHRHSEGFEWKPAVKETPADATVCTNCGAQMPAGTLFCENCGKALNVPQPVNKKTYTTPNGGKIEVMTLPTFGAGMDINMGAEAAGEIEGVPVKDIIAFIGPNAYYYIFKFKKLAMDKKRLTFNISAFFFRPLWFLYRKLWKFAVLAALLNFTTSLPTAITLAVESGALASTYLFPGIETAMSIGQIVNFVVNMIFGIMAVPLYKKDTLKRLKKLREECGADNNLYYSRLLPQCGPSKIGTIAIFMFSAYYIFSFFF